MTESLIDANDREITLTTGIYDLLKEQVRVRKVTPLEGKILTRQLKRAKQVTRRNLPENVVTVNARVTIKDLSTSEFQNFVFVAPDKAKKKNKTESILSTMGLALVGCREGDVVSWVFDDGIKEVEVVSVKRLA